MTSESLASKCEVCAQVETVTVKRCCSANDYYALKQTVAIVRHADRLDQTPQWLQYADRDRLAADTPLTELGHRHSEDAGKALAEISRKMDTPFKMVVSSPYLRCAQTASHLARVLAIPVQFDRDLGEVAHAGLSDDDRTLKIRDSDELKAALEADFPHVEYIKDETGSLRIRGKQPQPPEPLDRARLRFCFKVQELARQAALKLSSIIIVTHGDSVAAVASLLNPDWEMRKIPYTGYLLASRQVKVFDKNANTELLREPVYGDSVQWTLDLGPGFDCLKDGRYAERNVGIRQRLAQAANELMQLQSANSLSRLSDGSETDKYLMNLMTQRTFSRGFVGEVVVDTR